MAKPKPQLTPEQIKRVETYAGIGLSVEKMAAIFGISKRTLERIVKAQPEVNDALLKGRAIASSTVLKTAYDMATSGKNPVMTIFWLKVREHWKETQVLEHTGKDGAPIEHAEIVDQTQLQKMAQIILDKKK
jgi:hypothetical protein